jgi:hypothetical protein
MEQDINIGQFQIEDVCLFINFSTYYSTKRKPLKKLIFLITLQRKLSNKKTRRDRI